VPSRLCLFYGRNCSDDGRAVPGKSRCKAHGGGAWARVDPSAKKHYGGAWQNIRRRVLRERPYCQECGQPAVDVDHIQAVADGGTDERGNLRSLCRACHKKHTASQNRARREKRRNS